MFKNKTFLAIILARGGSKRLPNKNIKTLNGKPLISYTIEAALASSYIDNIIVSSDSEEILNIVKQHSVQTLKRPDSLATDTSSSIDATIHAINSVHHYDYILLLQPTSPLRSAQHIDEAIELLYTKQADAIVSVCEMEHSPLWANTLPKNNSMKRFISSEIKNKRSQDLEKYYRINGAIYICKTDILLTEKTFLIDNNCFAYKMSRNSSIDIDEAIDFTLAEALLSTHL